MTSDADTAVPERTHRHLVHLYEISKLLVEFEDAERTVPKVLAVVADAVPVRSAIFILETAGAPRTIVWQAEGQTASRLRDAKEHAQEAYRYLVSSGVARQMGEARSPNSRRGAGAEEKNFLILPLAVARRPIFGALQLETAFRPDELDLIFTNAVVNQLAIAIDRQRVIDARQAVVEEGRLRAEEKQALAEEAELRVRGQFEFARTVTESLGEGVLAVDLDGRLTLFNPAAEQMLGWKAEAAIGRRVTEIVQIRHPDGKPIADSEWPFALAIAQDELVRSDQRLLAGRVPDTFPVSYTAAPLRRAGQVVGAVLAFEDISERRRAQRALTESEERYRTLFGSAPMAVFVCDRKGIILAYNERAVELWGREPARGVERLRYAATPMAEVLRTGAPVFNVEVSIERRDGRRTPAIANFAALKDAQGEITGAIATFIDIAARKEAEEALRVAAERFRFLAESMPQKIATAYPDGEVYYFNEQWTEFTGVSAEQLKRESWLQVVHPDDVRESAQRWQKAVDTAESFEFEHRFRRADGVYHWHLTRARPMRDIEGNVQMWIGSSTDIDRQKHAETAQRFLAEAAAILSSSLDYRKTLAAVVRLSVPTLADVCFIDELSEDGKLKRLEVAIADKRNQGLADRLKRVFPDHGWPPVLEEVLTSGDARLFDHPTIEELAHDETDAEVMRILGPRSLMVVPLVARGRTLGALKFITAESGRSYSAADLAFAEGLARSAALAIDNARLYEQAQAAISARDNLLAIVSHDLRNPLSLILLNLDVLLQTSEAGERGQSRKHHLSIQRAAHRMNRLIEDLLDTASIEGERLAVEKSRIDVLPLVSEVFDALAPLARSKSLTLKNELPTDLPAVWADTGRLQQIFTNLLGNAIKFTQAGGTIAVRAQRTASHVTFSVADTGPGISEGDLPHLFDRLWQVERTARLGTGLGLYIVNGIVKAHGGRLWVESIVGQGSTFFFTLPVAPADADPQAEESATILARRPGVRKAGVEKDAADLERPATQAEHRKR